MVSSRPLKRLGGGFITSCSQCGQWRRQMGVREWQWVTVNVIMWWLQLQLLFQMWSHCRGKYSPWHLGGSYWSSKCHLLYCKKQKKIRNPAFICQGHWHTFAILPRDFIISFDGSSVLRLWTLPRHTRQCAMLMTSWARAWRVERKRCQKCKTNAMKIRRPDISGKVWDPVFWMCHDFPSRVKHSLPDISYHKGGAPRSPGNRSNNS